MIVLRSIVFNILFYLNLSVLLLATTVTLLLPRRAVIEVAKLWGRSSVWLLRTICGIRMEIRGRDRVPDGPLILASKHQSAWETFALLSLFDDPVFILKRELMWLPFFGWAGIKAGMIPIDRGAGPRVLVAMIARAREEIQGGRQLFIFPEGTRRPPHAEPQYKFGVSHIYKAVGVTCVPVALNSGLFWPRRSFLRRPGTIVVEFLEPIPPGLARLAFFKRMSDEIETASVRLVEEGEAELRARGILAAVKPTS